MAKKNFQTAPKPKLSLEDIEAYETSGVGKDTKTTKPQTRKSTNVGSSVKKKAEVANTAPPEPVEEETKEPTKRLSIDLPQSTHTRFKTACSATGRKMVKEIEDFIESRIEALEKEAGITRN